MICRTFKNGNFTIQHEAWYDGPATPDFEAFPAWVYEHADGFDVVEIGDFECWGNSYGAFPIKAYVNGVLGVYYLTPDDCERYATGHMVRIRRDSLAPLFTLPDFYKFCQFTTNDGRKGTLYTLCNVPTVEESEAMGRAGCEFFRVQCQYAPELAHSAVFVPNGTPFEFC